MAIPEKYQSALEPVPSPPPTRTEQRYDYLLSASSDGSFTDKEGNQWEFGDDKELILVKTADGIKKNLIYSPRTNMDAYSAVIKNLHGQRQIEYFPEGQSQYMKEDGTPTTIYGEEKLPHTSEQYRRVAELSAEEAKQQAIDPDASKSAIDTFSQATLVEEAAKSQARQEKTAQALNIYGAGGAALILEGIAAAGEMSRIKNDPTREYARETIADIQRRQEEGTLGLSGQQMAEAYKNVTAPLRAGTRQAELEAQRVAASQQGIMSAADQERIARRGARELGQQAQQGLAYVDQAQRQAVGDEITKMEQMMQYEAKAEATRAQTLGKSLGAAGQIIGTIAARRPVSVPQYTAAIAQQAYKSEVNLSSKQMTDMANYLTTHPYATSEQIAAEMGKIGITKISPEFYQAVRRT